MLNNAIIFTNKGTIVSDLDAFTFDDVPKFNFFKNHNLRTYSIEFIESIDHMISELKDCQKLYVLIKENDTEANFLIASYIGIIICRYMQIYGKNFDLDIDYVFRDQIPDLQIKDKKLRDIKFDKNKIKNEWMMLLYGLKLFSARNTYPINYN